MLRHFYGTNLVNALKNANSLPSLLVCNQDTKDVKDTILMLLSLAGLLGMNSLDTTSNMTGIYTKAVCPNTASVNRIF